MWSTKTALAAALMLGAAACGSGDTGPETPAYLPDDIREQREREAVQIERLEATLPGVRWSITDVGGTAVIEGSTPSLQLAPDGTLSGNTGCNSFTGTWSLERNQIAFGPIAATRMMCQPNLMAQEQSILGVLDEAILVGIGDEGLLFITTLDGVLMTAVHASD